MSSPRSRSSELNETDDDDFVPEVDLSSSAAELELRAEIRSDVLKTKFGKGFTIDDADEPLYLGGAAADPDESRDGDEPALTGYLGGETAPPSPKTPAESPSKGKGTARPAQTPDRRFEGYLGGAVADDVDDSREAAGYFDGEVAESEPDRYFDGETAEQYFDGEVAAEITDRTDTVSKADYYDDLGDSSQYDSQYGSQSGSQYDSQYGSQYAAKPGTGDSSYDDYYSEAASGVIADEDDFAEAPPKRGSSFIDELDHGSQYQGEDTLDEMFAGIDSQSPEDSYASEPYTSTEDGASLSSHEASRIIDAISKAPEEPSRVNYDHFTDPQEGDYHTGSQVELEGGGPRLWEAGYQPKSKQERRKRLLPVLLLLVLAAVAGVFVLNPDIFTPAVDPTPPVTFSDPSKEEMIAVLATAEKAAPVNWSSVQTHTDVMNWLVAAEGKAPLNDRERHAIKHVRGILQQKAPDMKGVRSTNEVVERMLLQVDLDGIQRFRDVMRRSDGYGMVGVEETDLAPGGP